MRNENVIDKQALEWCSLMQAGHWGFIEYRPQTEKNEYRPNIDREIYLKLL